MTIAEFQLPAFLQGQSREEIHARMLEMLPDRLDKSEGQFPYEFTIPTASEKAEMAQYTLPEAIRSLFPMWAQGQLLDYHAQTRGITRKPPSHATGLLEVSGLVGTTIPMGFSFTTESDYDRAGVPFLTLREAVLGEVPTLIPIRAITAGIQGNVAANSVLLMNTPMKGLAAIRNLEAITGGTDEETDEALRERIIEFDYNQGARFIGCVSDYKRWALEPPGTGSAQVLGAQDDTGLVTIVLLDGVGNPANTALCEAVYKHIMRPDDPEARLAPINAFLRVIPPTAFPIAVSAVITLDGSATLEEIAAGLTDALKLYYKEAGTEIRWTHVGALLLECLGVKDYDDLLLNGATENICIAADELAVTALSDISLTGGGER